MSNFFGINSLLNADTCTYGPQAHCDDNVRLSMTQSPTYSNKDLITYDRRRQVLTQLHPNFFTEIDRDISTRCAKRLNILQGNDSLMLNTEHEMSLFFDYILYTYKKSGINLMQRAFNNFSKNYTGETLDIFSRAKEGYFAYLEIVQAVGNEGLIVYNRERDMEHLMIDRGLNRTAKKSGKHAIVTNIIEFDEYTITTGAAIPFTVETEEGQKIQSLFDQYYHMVQYGQATEKTRLQYITDMYKTCLLEDITGQVRSPALPFSQ